MTLLKYLVNLVKYLPKSNRGNNISLRKLFIIKQKIADLIF